MAKKLSREIELNTGETIPIVGFGTWNLAGRAEQAVQWALAAGYRHIDTAKIYDTEAEIGRAVRKSGVPREELCIVTKVWNSDQGYERTLDAIDTSLSRLKMEYVDLYLVHWPDADRDTREATWRAMEEIFDSGKAKAIGVSNYERSHLAEMELYAETPPAANQIEMHPFNVPDEAAAYCHEHGIAVVNYAPLARARYLNDATLKAVAKKHERSVAQVMLRWGIQLGHAVIPKAGNRKHIEENIDIFDFELDAQDLAKLSALDEDTSVV
jgi:diketogulonate reductase-like aldo/keto reductase